MTFSTDGLVSEGAGDLERTWNIVRGDEGWELWLSGRDGVICKLRQAEDGSRWTGSWLLHERMPVELMNESACGTDDVPVVTARTDPAHWRQFDLAPYHTHIPALMYCVSQTKGAVLEFGCGYGSTPLLHMACGTRPLVTLDVNADWVAQFAAFRSGTHELRLLNAWDEYRAQERQWDVVLIDHAPASRRVHDIARCADVARFIVVHDTEAPDAAMEATLSRFRFRADYRWSCPWTTIVSNVAPILVEGAPSFP